MTPEEFRAAAHELIDWLVDRRVAIEDRPVRPPVEPGDIRRALPTQPPQGGDSASDLIADLESIIAPGITEVQHPMHWLVPVERKPFVDPGRLRLIGPRLARYLLGIIAEPHRG